MNLQKGGENGSRRPFVFLEHQSGEYRRILMTDQNYQKEFNKYFDEAMKNCPARRINICKLLKDDICSDKNCPILYWTDKLSEWTIKH